MNILSRKNLLAIIRFFSLIALMAAAALAVDYYFSSNTFCTQGADCDAVAKSDFGQKYGIYFPALGLFAYTAFFFVSFITRKKLAPLFGLGLIASALGAILFIAVQAFHIKAFCWLCMAIDSAAVAAAIPGILLIKNRHEDDNPNTRSNMHFLSWLALYIAATGLPLTWGTFQPSQETPTSIQQLYKDGKINIIEISSFQCGHCKTLHPELSKLINKYRSKINFKRFTIMLDGTTDVPLAYHCFEQQHREEIFADKMFDTPTFDMKQIREYAASLNMNLEKYDNCINDPESMKVVKNNIELINKSNFEGAPTIWIESKTFIGYNREKGIAPYEEAIKNEHPNPVKLPWAFIATLLTSAILFIIGIFLHFKQRTKKTES